MSRVIPISTPGTAMQWDGVNDGSMQEFLGLDATVAMIESGVAFGVEPPAADPRLLLYSTGMVQPVFPTDWVIKWGGQIIVMDEVNFKASFIEE